MVRKPWIISAKYRLSTGTRAKVSFNTYAADSSRKGSKPAYNMMVGGRWETSSANSGDKCQSLRFASPA